MTSVRGRIASFKITRPRIALVVMSEAKQSGTDSASPARLSANWNMTFPKNCISSPFKISDPMTWRVGPSEPGPRHWRAIRNQLATAVGATFQAAIHIAQSTSVRTATCRSPAFVKL